MKKFISLCLVIIWVLVIYTFSNMNSNKSNTKSKQVIKTVVSTTVEIKDNIKNKINNTNNITSKEEINEITNKLNLPVRKITHCLEYLLLFILVLYFLSFKKDNIFVAVLVCLLCAVVDEIHQLFVLNRTGQAIDVFIDMSGIILILMLYCFSVLIKSKTNKNKVEEKKENITM